jgi:hypothetical protein
MNTDLSLHYIFQEGIAFETIIQLFLPYLHFYFVLPTGIYLN